jgi:vacuolar-type H+-ATPase subunit E/Vma4
MTAEKIIEQIKKDSEKNIKQILKEAEKQAIDIINNAKKEAKIESDNILKSGEIQSENIKKIIVSKAHQESKRAIMNAKEGIIEECFIKAHSKFSKLNEAEYKKTVRTLIENGIKKIGRDCQILVSRSTDKKIVQDIGLNVTGNIEASGGIILLSKNGKITLDHTFDGILKREKDRIRIKVGKLLFSE